MGGEKKRKKKRLTRAQTYACAQIRCDEAPAEATATLLGSARWQNCALKGSKFSQNCPDAPYKTIRLLEMIKKNHASLAEIALLPITQVAVSLFSRVKDAK